MTAERQSRFQSARPRQSKSAATLDVQSAKMSPALKRSTKNHQIKKKVQKKTAAASTTKVSKHILNNEVKQDFKASVRCAAKFKPQVTTDDKVKIQLLTSIAVNMANPIKIPFVRLEHIDTRQVKQVLVINDNLDMNKEIGNINYKDWMAQIRISSSPKNKRSARRLKKL